MKDPFKDSLTITMTYQFGDNQRKDTLSVTGMVSDFLLSGAAKNGLKIVSHETERMWGELEKALRDEGVEI